MHALDQGVDAGDPLLATRQPEHGRVIADADHDIRPRRAGAPGKEVDEVELGHPEDRKTRVRGSVRVRGARLTGVRRWSARRGTAQSRAIRRCRAREAPGAAERPGCGAFRAGGPCLPQGFGRPKLEGPDVKSPRWLLSTAPRRRLLPPIVVPRPVQSADTSAALGVLA